MTGFVVPKGKLIITVYGEQEGYNLEIDTTSPLGVLLRLVHPMHIVKPFFTPLTRGIEDPQHIRLLEMEYQADRPHDIDSVTIRRFST